MLAVIGGFANAERAAFGIVLQNIKVSFHLSDTQLGLLTGIAFGLFYSLAGVPIGRWADRGNRVIIISAAAAIWSIMIVLCARALNFTQLLLFRIGVGAGEAGCRPASYSLIAEYFTRAERPRATAIYLVVGASLTFSIGTFLSGWVTQLYGWRITLMMVGLPGVALATAAFLTLKDPRFIKSSPLSKRLCDDTARHGGLNEVLSTLWHNATYRHLLISIVITSFLGDGLAQWQPAFFIRTHGLQTGEVGTLSTAVSVFGLLGLYLGGDFASRYAADNERLQLWVSAVLTVIFGLFTVFIYLASNYVLSFGALALVWFGETIPQGPLLATIQTVVPTRARALSIAVLYLCCNLIGMGFGPLAMGILSDAFRPLFGEQSLRYALMSVCPVYLWAGWHLWRASRAVRQDLERVRTNSDASNLERTTVENLQNSQRYYPR